MKPTHHNVGVNKLDKDGNKSQNVTVVHDLAKLWKIVDASARLSCDPTYPMKVENFDGVYEAIATIGINVAFLQQQEAYREWSVCSGNTNVEVDRPSRRWV